MNASNNLRILIAEDDFASRILLEGILVKWGYEVVVANDGAEAWEILGADNAPPIAVLDWMMPHLSGVELCEKIRERDQDLVPYIVMLTAKAEKSDVSAGLDAGADDYLVKPFDFTELSARLRVAKRAIALQRDLLESRKAVRYQALHDLSTGALNRGAVLDELSEVLSMRRVATVGLFAIDDHKRLLQNEGADSAESAVRGLVHALRAESPGATIGRYCADQLLCIWPETSLDDVICQVEVARKSLHTAAKAARAASTTDVVTFSCGLTPSTDSPSMELLLCYADTALYSARVSGDVTEVFCLELGSPRE